MIQGDCRDVMRQLIAEGVRVKCVVTSPPYWGLRDYGVDGQLGLERTYPEYIANMVEVFELVRQLLADDGTLWLNLGDCYYSGNRGGYRNDAHRWENSELQKHNRGNAATIRPNRLPQDGLKDKDLVGIPWRVAIALQDAGWWLRQDIVWAKRNCMPESVTDRCTTSHEYIFLMAKSERYYYDAEAIKEPADPAAGRDTTTARRNPPPGSRPDTGFKNGRRFETRNKRSVWTIPTQPYPEAHFATFPEALVEPCILAGSRPGDIIFDPFMGSGTVASVAQRLGRRWLGSELNPAYIELIERRTRGTLGLELSA